MASKASKVTDEDSCSMSLGASVGLLDGCQQGSLWLPMQSIVVISAYTEPVQIA
jgi:hypothetical protein